MKKFITLLILFVVLGHQAFALNAQVNNVANVGGSKSLASPIQTIPNGNLSSIVSLTCAIKDGNAASTQYYACGSLTSPAAVAQYQVPNAKTLYITSIQMQSSDSAASRGVMFGYGTAALLTIPSSAIAPVGAVDYGLSTALAASSSMGADLTGVPAQSLIPTFMSFPANSFPYVRVEPSGVNAIYFINLIGVVQ